jgi:cardiolipin synthase
MNLPNILTLIRVLLIPVFVILIINKSFLSALVTFGIAGLTDGIDGLIARLTHQRTELGAYLDPIADKLLLSSAFVTLAIIELIPSWLSVIVITRDVIILIGFIILILLDHRPKVEPSIASKITTDFQIATILITLMKEYYSIFNDLSIFVIYGTIFFTVLSGFHYIYIGTKLLNEKR